MFNQSGHSGRDSTMNSTRDTTTKPLLRPLAGAAIVAGVALPASNALAEEAGVEGGGSDQSDGSPTEQPVCPPDACPLVVDAGFSGHYFDKVPSGEIEFTGCDEGVLRAIVDGVPRTMEIGRLTGLKSLECVQ
jgi:hypothetical protein